MQLSFKEWYPKLAAFVIFTIVGSFFIGPNVATYKVAHAAQVCEQPVTVSFPFAVQADTGGVDFKSNVKVNGNVFSNANVTSSGFLNEVNGNVGAFGTVQDSLTRIKVNGTVAENQPKKNLPAFDPVIWQNAAAVGGTFTGDKIFAKNSKGNTLGPVIINGNLTLEENSQVFIQGTVYVTGNIIIKKNAELSLAGQTFASSGAVVMAAGKVDLDGNAFVNGTATSYLLIVSSNSSASDSITLQKNFQSTTVLFYSLKGGVLVGDNSKIVAAAGKQVTLDNNSQVNYVSDLAFVTFFCPPPVGTPSLILQKTASVSTVTAGNSFAYTIQATNTGSADTTNVVVSDTLSSSLDFISSVPVPTTQNITGGNTELTWNLGTITPGQSKTIVLTVRAKASIASQTTVTNTATALGGNVGQTTSNTTSTTINPAAVQQAALSVAKTVNQTSVPQGGNFTYTITVTNTSAITATNVVVSDALDPNVTLVSASPSQNVITTSEGVTTLKWNAGTIAPSGTYTITLTLAVAAATPPNTTINNTATTVSSNAPNASSSAPAVTVIAFNGTGVADLSIAKSVSNAAPAVGDQITFTLTLSNNGPDQATSVVVNDVLPGGLTFISSNPSQGSYDSGTGIWSVGTVDMGSQATLQIVAMVNTGTAGTTIINTATVASSDQINDPAGDIVTTAVNVASSGGGGGGSAMLTVVKVVVNDNTGTKVVSDFPLFVNGNSVVSGQANTLTPGAFTVTETNQTGYTGTFSGDCNASGSITLADGDSKVCTLTNDDNDPGLAAADPAITKTVNGQPVEGAAIQYTVTVTNSGGTPAADVIVLDSLPSQVTFVSSSPSQGTYDAGTGIWTVGALAPAQTATLTINATVNTGIAPITVINMATISNAPGDGNTANNSAQASFSVAAGGGSGGGTGGTGNGNGASNINVIINVVNDSGGTRQAGNFTVNVTGTNVLPSFFPGSSNGTLVNLDPGNYGVKMDDNTLFNYVTITPISCSGTIAAGETKTCTITLDDPAVSNAGGGGGISNFSSGSSGGGGGGGSSTTDSSGGGSATSGGGSSSGGGGGAAAPSGEVAGDTTAVPAPVPTPQIDTAASITMPAPEVQGATTLPRTGTPIEFYAVITAAFWLGRRILRK